MGMTSRRNDVSDTLSFVSVELVHMGSDPSEFLTSTREWPDKP